jgi:hypothetical protein
MNAPMRLTAAALNRTVGWLVTIGFVIIGVALDVRNFPTLGARRPGLTETIYPCWMWVLVGVGLAAGVTSVLAAARPGPARHAAPAVAAVAAAQLAGSGFVAFKHWQPAIGMGGGYGGNLTVLKQLAIVIGLVGVATAVAAIRLLVANGDLPHPASLPVRVLSCAAGALIAVALPVSQAAASAYMRDITSVGAVGLIYAGPWAVTVALAGWLTRPAATAALGSVALGCCLGLYGPQMTDLINADPKPAFATVLAVTVMVLTVVLVRGRRGAGVAQPA